MNFAGKINAIMYAESSDDRIRLFAIGLRLDYCDRTSVELKIRLLQTMGGEISR